MTTPPPPRPRESDSDYIARCHRWRSWLVQEPLVDLSSVSDTEVAEYRQWAGTKKAHDDLVKSLVEHFKEKNA